MENNTINWQQASEQLVDIIMSCPTRVQQIFSEKLHRYIASTHPDVLIDHFLEQRAEIFDYQAFYTSALLALELPHRIEVFQRCIRDLGSIFPVELEEIEQFVEEQSQQHQSYFTQRKERVDKLNRYLKRIDGAINNRRYSLALGLANRCLKEYYSHFLKHTVKYDFNAQTTSMNQMAFQIYRYIIKYFKANNIPYSATRLLFITIATNALFIAMSSTSYMVDKSVATYARDNVNSIVRFLLRYS